MGTGCARFSGWKWIFPSPSPSINHFFCLVLAKPEEQKKTPKNLHDASNMSREPQSKALARLRVLLCFPSTALCFPMGFGPPENPSP